MLSSLTIARRALLVSGRGLPMNSLPAAVFSTQTETQAETLEKMLHDLRWNAIKDNVKELRALMNEPKTNHAVIEPDALFSDEVSAKMQAIQDMISAPAPSRDAIDASVFGLKTMVKGKMYGYQGSP